MIVNLKLRYEGGDANNGVLEFYDGSTSIQGFAQSLSIATHAYINGDLIKKATALRGAKIFMHPARPGSFLTSISILMEANPAVTGAIVGFSANIFHDFVKVLYNKAVGAFDENAIETNSVKKAIEKKEPFFDEVAEVMEGSLQRAHRPIGEGVETISLERPRSSLVTFDADTKSWVETREEMPEVENQTGNITRYNAITQNGRVYVDQLERIIPFRIGDKYPFNRYGVVTWSLHGSNSGKGGTNKLPKNISFKGKQIISASGKVKRVILTDAFPTE